MGRIMESMEMGSEGVVRWKVCMLVNECDDGGKVKLSTSIALIYAVCIARSHLQGNTAKLDVSRSRKSCIYL
jgi:hypothetical protein